jgi:hypothetical protein
VAIRQRSLETRDRLVAKMSFPVAASQIWPMHIGMRASESISRHGARKRMLRQFACSIVMGLISTTGWAADLPSLPAPMSRIQSTQSSATTELSDAAACIERGDDAGAIAILTRHLISHPKHVTVRAYLAEVHFRRGEWQAARTEFDRFVEEAQIAELELPRLIHGHTRLMTIAEKLSDKYSEHLHRGIGLYLLSRQTTGPDAGLAERFLCAAAGELARAKRIHPDRARSHWYRYRVWRALGQLTAARSALRAAVRDAAFCDLTLAEKLDVAIARDAELRPDH